MHWGGSTPSGGSPSGDSRPSPEWLSPLSAMSAFEIQKMMLLLFLAGQVLRFVATSVLSPRVFWPSVRLMHVRSGS